MVDGFLSAAQIAHLDDLMERGWHTLEDWTTTDQVTIARQSGVANTFDVVSIKLDDREGTVTGSGTPTADTELSGVLRLWTTAVTAKPVWRGDRFVWNGQACVIATGPIRKRGGVSEYAFTLSSRNA